MGDRHGGHPRRAREVRPYDEEFLLAALLHHVGRAIDADNSVVAGLKALEGTLTERTAWLIENLPQVLPRANRAVAPRTLQALRHSEWFEDLELLRHIDMAARVPGAHVGTVDEALTYLRTLEALNEDDVVNDE